MTWPPRPFYQVIANIRRLASTLQRQGSSECGSDRDNLISANRSPSALTNAFQAACTIGTQTHQEDFNRHHEKNTSQTHPTSPRHRQTRLSRSSHHCLSTA